MASLDEQERRKQLLNRHKALKTIRSGREPLWRDLSSFIRPRRGRLFAESESVRGGDKHENIINGTAGKSLNTLDSGMMAGITSPARPWFGMATHDQELNEIGSVKYWLHLVCERILDALAKSNAYSKLQEIYGDMGQFGPGVLIIEEDDEDAIRAYSVPIGEYCLALSDRGEVDTLYRETTLTVAQLKKKFGLKACSQIVQDHFRDGRLDVERAVLHIIEPREDRDPGAIGPKNMRYASFWLELEADATTGFLRESGFHERPFMAPRWSASGNEVYGYSPAMDALGDVKALQLYERESADVAERIGKPPMGGPATLQGMPVSLVPAATNWFDEPSASNLLRPLYQVPPEAVSVFDRKIQQHEQRIKSAFYADIWLMLSMSDGPQMTAEEVRERHEEKMLQLGPVMERLEDELLNPLIARVFGILMRSGRLPPPPPEISGQELLVEYQSIMSQAQKAVGIGSLERFVNFIGQLGAVRPEALDKLDVDQVANKMASGLGVSPEVVVSDDKVKELRGARAKQQQQQQAMQQAAIAAKGAKDLAGADTSGQNALTQMLGPVAAAQAGGQ